MERARTQRGFTIVEVLIVLAVTSAMFILAAYAINGKQNETEFQQSVNNIRLSIQQTINQISAGEYANVGNFTCNDIGGTTLQIKPGANPQGTNGGCVLLGEAMQFGVKNTSPQQYRIYPIAGLQHDSSGNDITSLKATKPTAIAPGNTTNKGVPNASEPGYLQDGLTSAWMQSGGKNIAAVAFISSLGQYKGGNLVSGSQQLSLYPVASISGNDQVPGSVSPYVVDAINKNLSTAPQNPAGGVQICFASGGTNQSGLITLGSGSRSLTVTQQIMDGTTDCK